MTATSASVTEPVEVRPGARLGRYEILVGVAQGGMARVWAARQQGHRGFSKVVAIKTILPALTSDPTFEAMFLDEARVAAGVHHPNVCQIFDLGEEAGVLYLAMEWVAGESLARILKPPKASGGEKPVPQRFNARIAARIVADAAAGLHAAHELCDEMGQRLNVVHRDVSPQNILVSLTGNVKVTDFGVAKALGNSTEATAAGQIKGKAAYMSPEQASGTTLDRRSDIFALGIVLYEVTTGRRPFQGDNQVAVLKSLLQGTFDPPSAVVPGYPRELESIVMRALAMDPMQRFPSADRMRIALEEWLARSGPVVTETQVGALVRERVGEIVEQRQSRIRERQKSSTFDPRASHPTFTAPSEASSSKISAPSAVSHVGPTAAAAAGIALTPSGASHPIPAPLPPLEPPGPAPPAPPAAPQTTGSTAMVGVAIGAGLFLLMALVGVGVWAMKRGGSEAPPPKAQAAVQTPAPAPEPAPAPTPSAAPREAKLGTISIRPVEPKDGVTFEIDGKPLAAGMLRIERPEPGKVRLLTANAEGYERDVYRIDDATPDVLDVFLAKKQAEPTPQAQPASPSQPASPASPPEKKKPVLKPDIPDNPF